MKRILLVDDHAVVRDGIKRMFDDRAGDVFSVKQTPLPLL